eukprot:CAMPEP_0170509758 /NCGR_PEP_ID=MMETSP0208-20121228/65391_1 /TAXON_ID=197538 /ORGANISM="Strombidium inclinatum, Strain S3" /LENGTH=75 /DNA_ID=CAMNT_0010793151 /DNA_START=1515 /DNA_END=1742 /DNA_ORIENTATION=+
MNGLKNKAVNIQTMGQKDSPQIYREMKERELLGEIKQIEARMAEVDKQLKKCDKHFSAYIFIVDGTSIGGFNYAN